MPQVWAIAGLGLVAPSPLAPGSSYPEIPSAWRGGSRGLVAGGAGQSGVLAPWGCDCGWSPQASWAPTLHWRRGR